MSSFAGIYDRFRSVFSGFGSVSNVWRADIDSRQEMITRAFQACGMLNAVDGSDHLISVEGYDGPYSLDGEVDEADLSDSSELSESEDDVSDSDSDSSDKEE